MYGQSSVRERFECSAKPCEAKSAVFTRPAAFF